MTTLERALWIIAEADRCKINPYDLWSDSLTENLKATIDLAVIHEFIQIRKLMAFQLGLVELLKANPQVTTVTLKGL